ncbi:MAG: RluA family pseudouridine synthase [Planctomycetes bacterium]|nr:RluA family pseudouridine synthase [Planctomycetota bacterium]
MRNGGIDIEVRDSRGDRLDKWLSKRLQEYSRSYLQALIRTGGVLVNGVAVKASHTVSSGDLIRLTPASTDEPPISPQPIPLDILHEDEAIVVVNKPPHLMVHPGAGNHTNTLVNALAYHIQSLSQVAGETRPGIVHRLDKDTSGVIVCAKTDIAHYKLARQFQERLMQKVYLAVVYGVMPLDSDVIQLPIGKSRRNHEKMMISPLYGKEATTTYTVLERFDGFTFVRVAPRTGRTHQISLHLSAIGFPVVSDPVYSQHRALLFSDIQPRHLQEGNFRDRTLISRQALHAHCLTLDHPTTGTRMSFVAELAPDMEELVRTLRKHAV